ncbi:MAG: MFS transporter [Actinomycetales bacterium]|nr:MFS transporter [Actinomycetales bacterium]
MTSEPSEPDSADSDQQTRASARWRIDVTPLKVNKNFRWLWASSTISGLGSMFTYVALPYQIQQLTNSYVAVGVLGLVEIMPLIIFGLYGGVLSDARDRRSIAIITELSFALCVLLLALNASLTKPHLWPIYVLALVMASLDGIQRPSLDAITPRIVPREQLASASALGGLTRNATLIFGTAISGIVVTQINISLAYFFDALTFLLSIACVLKLPKIPPTNEHQKPSLKAIVEGASYAWSRKDLLGSYLIDTTAMVFAFPNALFPFMAQAYKSPSALGLLYSAGAIGGIIATATSGWTSRINRHGMGIIWAAAVWGVGIAIVGVGNSLPAALIGLAIAGGADMISVIFRSLLWNSTIPDHLRGRLASIELLSYSIGPQLGQMRASVSARFFGLQRALVSGGVLCVIAVLACANSLPALKKYDANTSEFLINNNDI